MIESKLKNHSISFTFLSSSSQPPRGGDNNISVFLRPYPVGVGLNPEQIVIICFLHQLFFHLSLCPVKKLSKNIYILYNFINFKI
jgi:hypothetical protein